MALPAMATVMAGLRGVVHDGEHRPIAGADVDIQMVGSAVEYHGKSDRDGGFDFPAVPPGSYVVTVQASGFAIQKRQIEALSGASPVLHFALEVAGAGTTIEVNASLEGLNTEAGTRTTVLDRRQIASYAGADQSNSFRMVTEFTPGAYMVHDQLHIRGGHQVTWAIDGVPLPNTNIAANVGPQFDPKDVDEIEEQSGSYSAASGDRTYGVFNVAMRNGFERDRRAELIASAGNYNTTDDLLSFGDHTEKFAYYASLNGNRSDDGLEPPTSVILHDQASGGGGFASLIYNAAAKDQIHFDGGFRADYYQVPNDPQAQAAEVRDREREQDAFGILSWTHTVSEKSLVTVSPFYHFNRAAFEGGPKDVPSAISNNASNYAGGQVTASSVLRNHHLTAGIYAFAQQDNTYFAVAANDGSGFGFAQRVKPGGNLEAAFAEDTYNATNWLMVRAGLRMTHFGGLLNENAADPRIGASVRIPRVNWVARAAYSRFYQAPPLETLSGPLLQYAATQGAAFLPLHGERDEQHEFGLTIPVRGWTADFAYFRTGAHDFFDHDVIGNSNIFLPLTIHAARINGYEATVRSPLLRQRFHAHLVFSNQQAEGFGGVTGGLLSFAPPASGGYYLDHDQRNTLATGAEGSLPWGTQASVDLNYGSGFLMGDGPQHLPGYYTVDMSVSKSFGERLTVRAYGTNLGDTRYQLDTSNTFGGTHFADPRRLALQLRYSFRY